MRREWSGVCYDGPREGEHFTQDRPFFEFHTPFPPLELQAPWANNPTLGFEVSRYFYRWSRPLRKWVFDPTGRTIGRYY